MNFAMPVPFPGIVLASLVGIIALLAITFSVPATATRKGQSRDKTEGI